MKHKYKILVGVVVYNEENKLLHLLQTLEKVIPNSNYFFVFVNDHSTDKSSQYLADFVKKYKNTLIIINQRNSGVGKSIKNIVDYGLEMKYDLCVIMAGNGKDNPHEIKKIVTPIISHNYDYVQGSRFLNGGSYNNLPFPRKMMIVGFTSLFFLFTGFHGTDASNGFRAYKLSLFKDRRIKIHQTWLDRYEFETYLHYKVITLGYRICEVAVSKNYLVGIKNYSKIRPFIDWWKMIRPLIYLKLHLRS